MHTLELKIPPAIVGLVFAAAAAAAAWSTPRLDFDLPVAPLLATGLAVTGLVVGLLGVAAFRSAQTTFNPFEPAKASRLVVGGIYRWTRNPMYLAMLLQLVAWAVLLTHPLAFALAAAFVPIMNRLQIAPEERILTGKFGSEFIDYQSRVRRWI